MIAVRDPASIHQVDIPIDGGTCHGRWHFSFDRYFDPRWMRFGTLRVFNDDTLTPGAVWPLHPHREIEVVTYCAGGEFRHEDENGEGGVLEAGKKISHSLGEHRGAYLYVLSGGPVRVNGATVSPLGAATLSEEPLSVRSDADAELLLADVLLVEEPDS